MAFGGNLALALVLLAGVPIVQASSADDGSSASANPIRRVVSMLQMMQKKITSEAAEEAELYQKFMCWCQSGGADLKKSIADANAAVPQISAAIDQAVAEKARLEEEVKGHQQDKADAKQAMAEATAIREKEASAFAAEKAESDANLDALAKATAAIEKGMTGAFLQTRAASLLRSLATSSVAMADFDRQTLASFLSQGEGEGNGYVPQAGEITGILKQMSDTMAGDLKELIAAEKSAKQLYGELMAAKTKMVEASTAAIESKLERIGQLGVEIVTMKNDLSDNEKSLIEDTKFLANVEKSCASKKAEWEERTATRAQELAAITDTIKILNDDDALELFKKTLPSPSLVQLSSKTGALRRRALALIKGVQASVPRSERAALEFIAVALGGKKTDFSSVIKMIDDLVALLKKEQADDDNKKEYCEVQIDSADDKKKELQHGISDLDTVIQETTGSISTLADEIKSLTAGIVALDKSVAEATETRKNEHSEYTELMASDAAATELLGVAKNRLNKFYNKKLYVAPPKRELSREDRIAVNMGGTLAPTAAPGGIAGTGVEVLAQTSASRAVRDAPPPAPETFGAYAKKGEESTGVIAMIDMLVADLAKEMTEAEAQEKNAQSDYVSMMQDSAEKRSQDSKAITDKESAKAGLEADLQKATEEQASKTKELMATEEYISNLHGECDWLVQNYDLRKTARSDESAALANAKAVLSGADFALIQRSGRSSPVRSLRGA